MKTDEYKVRFEKKGILFIEIPEKDMVIELENTYDDIPKKVELICIENKYYIKGTEPKKKTIKKGVEE